MKRIATMALMLNLGVAGIYAHERSVKMTYSGTEGASATDLQFPDTKTSEFNFAGNGTLGSFTFRSVEADGNFPQQSTACPANPAPSAGAAGGKTRDRPGTEPWGGRIGRSVRVRAESAVSG